MGEMGIRPRAINEGLLLRAGGAGRRAVHTDRAPRDDTAMPQALAATSPHTSFLFLTSIRQSFFMEKDL